MSDMSEMAMVYERVKQAVLDSGDVVSAKDYERLVKCCAKMVEILETCVHRAEGAKDASFARDIRIYMNLVKGMLEDPFFTNANFRMIDSRNENMSWSDMWQAQRDAQAKVDAENAAKAPKRRGRKAKQTHEQRVEKLRKYQRDYQRKLREKKKAAAQGSFVIIKDSEQPISEQVKQIELRRQQRARKQILMAAVKAKMAQLGKKKGK